MRTYLESILYYYTSLVSLVFYTVYPVHRNSLTEVLKGNVAAMCLLSMTASDMLFDQNHFHTSDKSSSEIDSDKKDQYGLT